MEKGKWEIVETVIDGVRHYRAERKLRADSAAGPDNEEHYGVWSPDRDAVEVLVDLLNEKEAEA